MIRGNLPFEEAQKLPDNLVVWKGRTLHHGTDPQSQIEKKVASWELRRGTLFFLPSPLQGWGVASLLSRLPADCFVIFSEIEFALASWSFHFLQKELGEKRGDARLFWLEADSESSVAKLLQEIPLAKVRRVELLALNGGWMLHSARYREIQKRLESEVNLFWTNKMTSLKMAPLWIRNIFRNIAENAATFEKWPNWGTSTTVVCGAGVSLESAIPWLVRYRERFKLLAVDTAVGTLLAASLSPDAIVCVEAQSLNLKDFVGASGLSIDLFGDLSCHPDTFRIFRGRQFGFISVFADLQFWRRLNTVLDLPQLRPLGSVGVVACEIARRLTTGALLLTGLDFAFPHGKTHSRQSPALIENLRKHDRTHSVEQIGTWQRSQLSAVQDLDWLTTTIMRGYADGLKDIVRTEHHRIFRLGDGGLSLEIPTLALKEPSFHNFPELEPRAQSVLSEVIVTGQQSQSILLAEEKHLEDFFSIVRRINSEGLPESAEEQERMLEQIEKLDYLYFQFPDRDEMPRLETSFLSRLLAATHWHHDLIKKLLNSR